MVFGRRLRSGAEPEAAPVPRVLYRAHQALHETEAAIQQEWEALEAERQRLSDWHVRLEERTKATSHQVAFERSKLEEDRKDYKRDLRRVYELRPGDGGILEGAEGGPKPEGGGRDLKRGPSCGVQAKLEAKDQILETQRVQQAESTDELRKWRLEL